MFLTPRFNILLYTKRAKILIYYHDILWLTMLYFRFFLNQVFHNHVPEQFHYLTMALQDEENINMEDIISLWYLTPVIHNICLCLISLI